MEVKHRNIIGEFCKGYLHLNFLVKGLDGKHTMFFAEVHHNLRDEKDVYLCKPLGEDDFNPSKKSDQGIYTFPSIFHVISTLCSNFIGAFAYVFFFICVDHSLTHLSFFLSSL